MQSYTAESYTRSVHRCLDRIRDRVVEELEVIFCQAKGLQAEFLEVVIFPDGILNELPITLFFKDQFQNPVLGGTFELGNSSGPVLTPDEKEQVYRFDEDGVETLEIELEVLIEWFSTCWLAANGSDFQLPAYLSLENDLEAFDLKEMKWIPNPTRIEKENKP